MSKLATLDDLAAAVPSGSYVALGGFQLNRVPMELLRALVEHGADDLRTVSAPNALALDFLASRESLTSAECGFIGFQYEDGFVIAPAIREALVEGKMELEERDVYDTIESLRATAGAPDAQRPAVALLHAQRADRDGNLRLEDPYADVVLAEASRTVLATTEELVDRIEDPTIPAAKVAMVALCRGGAAPTSCFGYYGRDPEAIRKQVRVRSVVTEPVCRADVDRLVVFMSRQVRDGEVVVTGLASALAMLAIQLARGTHAPSARYINCIGAVNPSGGAALATSVEAGLLDGCEATIALPELFDLARDGGVDTMFFGAAQADRDTNINLSRIGTAEGPAVKLAGPAGSPSMRSFVRRVVITIPRQSPRNLIDQVDVATSSASPRNEETVLVTNLAVWKLREEGLRPISLHAGVSLPELGKQTGFDWPASAVPTTAPPTVEELAALDSLDPSGVRYQLLGSKPSYRPIATTGEDVS